MARKVTIKELMNELKSCSDRIDAKRWLWEEITASELRSIESFITGRKGEIPIVFLSDEPILDWYEKNREINHE